MTTAILLSSIFTDFGGNWLYVVVVATILVTLVLGLFLTQDKKNKEDK